MFGNESLDHITPEIIDRFIDYWRSIKPEQLTDKTEAGKLIKSFYKIICQDESNKNVILTDERSIVGKIKSGNRWKKEHSEEIVEMAFKNSAIHLHNTRGIIDKQNPKVFKMDSNKKVFNEVGHFSKRGFKENNSNPAEPSELRRIKTGFKVALLDKSLDF